MAILSGNIASKNYFVWEFPVIFVATMKFKDQAEYGLVAMDATMIYAMTATMIELDYYWVNFI